MTKTLVQVIDDEVAIQEYSKRDELLSILNTPPPRNWIKEHPMAKNVKYLPIEKTELLLTRIFQVWYVEVLEAKQLLNSIAVTVRLFYKDPLTGDMLHQDGVGAVAVQTSKGASASDMSQIVSDGVMKALPSAESYALKDASEKIGKIFGKDLNRKDVLAFTGSYNTDEAKELKRKKLEEQTNEDN